jgi:hypothetical protein
MISIAVYLAGLIILALHFAGILRRYRLEWIILIAPFAIFAVNIMDFLE